MKARRYANHQTADIGVTTAMRWLLAQGYEVFLPIGSHGVADLIAVRGKVRRLIDVKVVRTTTLGKAERMRSLTERQRKSGVEIVYVTEEGLVRDGSGAGRNIRRTAPSRS